MATLLIGIAVNVGVSLLLNRFFGPEGQDVVQEGPRLQDLSVSSAAYGQMRQIGYGSFRMGGNMIWSPGIREIVREVEQDSPSKGGAGGGSVTTRTFEYRASFAIGFGEGPANEIIRIWADSKLIYDASGAGTGIGKYRFRFYPGDELQLPDPMIEADVGAGQAPAYRGEAYMVADDWPLADFGNRIPNISAEIAFQSTDQKLRTILSGGASFFPGSGLDGPSQGARVPENDLMVFWSDNSLQIVQGTTQTLVNSLQYPTSIFLTTFNVNLGVDGFLYRPDEVNRNYKKFDLITGAQLYELPVTIDFITGGGARIGTQIVNLPGIGRRLFQWVKTATSLHTLIENEDGNGTTEINIDDSISAAGDFIQDHFGKTRLWIIQESASQTSVIELSVIPVIGALGGISAEAVTNTVGVVQKNGVDVAGAPNVEGWVWVPIENAFILSYGDAGIVKLDIDTGNVTHTNTAVSFSTKHQYTLGPSFSWGDAVENDFISISTEDLSVIDREPISGFFTGSLLSAWNEDQSLYEWETNSVTANRFEFTVTPPADQRMAKVFLDRTTSLGEDLASIVSDVCQRGGLSISDIDVTDLVGINVDGFVVNRQTAVKEVLRPLVRAYIFDAVESDFLIKFVRRGKNLVLANPIPANDIGLVQGADDEPFREVRTQESELPERVTVVYADKTQDYQQASQSDKRQVQPTPTVRTSNELTLELPVAMDANTGRRVAQRQLFIAWAERRSFETQLPWTYLALDPADSVEMVLDTETARVRLSEVEVGADLTLAIRAVLEDEDADISVIPGDSGTFDPQAVPDLRPTKLFNLNLPLLRNQDAGLQEFSRAYFAMSGFSGGWPGAILYESNDEGATYQEVVAQSVGVAWGVVTDNAIPDPVSTTTWNRDQQFTIRVLNGVASFQSATDLEVLNGRNLLAAIKRDGTIELIQFRDAVVTEANLVTVSQLIRARRGTDNESTGHAVGEIVVLLTSSTVNSFRLELAEISVLQQFRPVTLGTLIEDAQDVFATYTGRDLKPYPVSSLTAVDSGGNIVIDWLRQTRFNGELRDGTDDVPLNETIERYEIEIIRGSTLLNTYGDAAPFIEVTNFTYTSDQQTADGVVSADVLTIRVYQISAIVGRGSFRDVTFVKP